MRKQPASEFLGTKYSHFTIVKDMGIKKGGRFVLALCDCGIEKQVRLADIKCGSSTNCGCIRRKKMSEINTSHGLSTDPLYSVWQGIKDRCYRKTNEKYDRYGGRGIVVCEEWKNDFKAFYDWAMEKGWRQGLEIDRENNDGIYSPVNCRVTTVIVNRRNTSSNRMLEYNGEKKCLSEWAEIIGISQDTLKDRVGKLKWSVEKALSTPLNSHLCS